MSDDVKKSIWADDTGYTRICATCPRGTRHGIKRALIGKEREVEISDCPLCVEAVKKSDERKRHFEMYGRYPE